MGFEVRRAADDDVPAIRRIARESWHAAYDEILGAEAVERAIESWYGAAGLTESITREDGRFLVAATASAGSGEVVGFAQGVRGDDGPARLPRLYVHPDRWGAGVGTALLDRIEGWLREAAAERLRLAVLADNEVGNAFYEARGYEVVAEREEDLFGATVAEYVRGTEL